eukprot:TRINITY_DN17259_c0_g1_i1.p1 TRINITY_DN17259_c0_g1~~TRINITY_DN17259_c0_g1_i1.p1  ORF type:complete len:360 (-),score=57.47 TRINITY_DN17259_c0_g1_i1:359-1438(-)
MQELQEVAEKLTVRGKGLLASDESTGTIGKRFQKAGIENIEENRRSYREVFYTSEGIGEYLSGAIMFKETLVQNTSSGEPFVKCLEEQNILAGIKVDEGLTPLVGAERETITRGLDNLSTACDTYVQQGAKFAKWRSALTISQHLPSERAIEINCHQLALYAAICQARGLVPIVEPEILIDGDHDINKFAQVSEQVLSSCMNHLHRQNVVLEAALLKPQMIIAGADYPGGKSTSQDISSHTIRVMKRCIPPALPGIMFLSGGQTEEQATINLNTINQQAEQDGGCPWSLSFSFGRALQASVLEIWGADQTDTQKAKNMAYELAKANGLAQIGKYNGPHPSLQQNDTLRENFRGWRTDVK